LATSSWRWLELLASKKSTREWTIGGDEKDSAVPILNGANYNIWKLKMKAYLQSKEIWSVTSGNWESPNKYIQEEVEIPESKGKDGKVIPASKVMQDKLDQINPEWCQWDTADDKAMGSMSLRMAPSPLNLVKDSAEDTWNSIAAQFGGAGAAGIFVDYKAAN
jgi:hypothetical protein